MIRIPLNPDLPTWMRERAGLDTLALAGLVQTNGLAFQEEAYE